MAAWAPYEAALKRTGTFVGPLPQALEDAKNAAEAARNGRREGTVSATTPTTLAGLGRYCAMPPRGTQAACLTALKPS